MILGVFFDALYPEQQKKRDQYLDTLKLAGFNYIATALNEGNEPFIEKCLSYAIKLGYHPNGGSDAWIKGMLNKYDHIKDVYCYDDANRPEVTPQMVKERVDKFKTLMTKDQKTSFSGSFQGIDSSTGKDSWPNYKDYFGICDHMGLQIYHWRWYWTRAFYERCKMATDSSKTQEFWAYPTICRNYWDLKTSPWVSTHPTLKVQDYPHINWLKMYVFSALIAGIKNIVFYTSYWSDPKNNFFETTNLMQQPELLQMREVTSLCWKYSDYFDNGVRKITVDEPTKIEAQWKLGENILTVTVSNLQPNPNNNNAAPDMLLIPEIDVKEVKPKAPTPPVPTSSPRKIKFNIPIEFEI